MLVNRLVELRERAGLSQEALAKKAGVNRQVIRRLESGETKMLHGEVEGIAAVLGVPWYALLLSDGAISGLLASSHATAGLADSAEPFEAPSGHRLARTTLAEHEALWRVKGNHLDALGIIDGDIGILNMSPDAVSQIKTGDVVVAQVYGPGLTSAATVTRQFVWPALLIVNSHTIDAPALHMDRLDIAIKGIIGDTWSGQRRP